MNPARTQGRGIVAWLAALTTVALLLTGCAAQGSDRGRVVVTTNILGDITRAVVGDEAEVTVLMRPNADPHSFAISARQAAELETAGLLVYNGLGLEEGVLRNVEAAAQAGTPALEVAAAVDPIRFSGGEEAGEPDPHFWTDPRRVRTAVQAISRQVTENVAGVDAGAIRANADRYLRDLDELDSWMTGRFAAIPDGKRKLVTNHHVFGYLAARYGFEVIGAVVPSGTTLASPSPSDLAGLAATIRDAGVGAVFADSSQPDRLATVLADQAGVRVQVVELYSESLTERGGGAGTYLELMRANTDAIVAGLTST
ncbi:zinc ABC transporter substrate-binding protein AztC [Prauserella muralis]|uniref:ABC transporter substrate-binding protein n=1 Tax=Prauserella muralis TaxID=588067 RepID=A0A2V4AT71_9PSEU|nr:zinc ABC transporter substrate-binding protein AztC [Prauserella muralis]PXY22741.1 ABC transporter substrate-binding protein [Prauserella muralis]TWE28470.1 zinc/manganese transport system substrate-binding protein [Prauserella muralis]